MTRRIIKQLSIDNTSLQISVTYDSDENVVTEVHYIHAYHYGTSVDITRVFMEMLDGDSIIDTIDFSECIPDEDEEPAEETPADWDWTRDTSRGGTFNQS